MQQKPSLQMKCHILRPEKDGFIVQIHFFIIYLFIYLFYLFIFAKQRFLFFVIKHEAILKQEKITG